MLRRLIGEDVRLQEFCSEDLRLVRVDPGQMDQILMNLAVNARDAMPTGGLLTIQAENVDIPAAPGRGPMPMEAGAYVLLSLSDTGTGMREETRKRAFEPFFTTKGLGQGTGLGLSTVYGIVKQHNGYIWIDSQPGEGTTFRIYIPAAEAATAACSDESLAPSPIPRGTETLLVVEDEAAVRVTLKRALEALGYNVLVAASGKEAETLSKEQSTTIDLLVSDVVLPDWPGPQVYEHLASQRRGLKVVYISGYAEEETLRRAGVQDGVPFIQKPFNREVLGEKVREVLAA